MLKNKEKIRNILIIILIAIISGIIFYYQTQKVGLHEDEGYTLSSSVSNVNGLMSQYVDSDHPVWLSRSYVTDYMSLKPINYFNLASVYINQAWDNHPPVFYSLVHFSTILFGGAFSLYSVFVVNIIAFILSCFVIKKILKILDKENLAFPSILFYGLSMGTISMVLFQRMYMLLTFFVLLYFYLTLKIYKNDFKMDKKMSILLGITTVLGFLTQYFFAVFAVFVFLIMLIKMIRTKQDKIIIRKYFINHIIYAVVGILLFVPCIKHLLFSSRGLSNLGNTGYLEHFWQYIKHLAYAFSINENNTILIISILILFAIAVGYLFKKSKEKTVIALFTIPSIFFFVISVKMTSFQELRYIMPIIPFVAITFILVLDALLEKIKFRNVIISFISLALVIVGFVFSEPIFLYKDYQKCLDIAEKNKDKSFVYVYDNFFNHMQSVPEMMIYEKTLIINMFNDEMQYIVNDESLNNEDSFILSIKNYLDNDAVIQEIKDNTDFENFEKIYVAPDARYEVGNNLYLVSK